MKFLLAFLPLVLPAVLGNAVDHRRAQLTTTWAVAAPTVAYDDATDKFTVSFSHGAGSGATSARMEVFNTCPNGADVTQDSAIYGGVAPTKTLGSATSVPPYMSNMVFSAGGLLTATTNPGATESAGTFCVRVGLQDLGGVLIHFKQIEITITYTLVDGFEDFTFSTKAFAPTTGSVTDAVTAFGSLCSGYPASGDPFFMNGEQICISVCPVTAASATTTSPMADDQYIGVGIPELDAAAPTGPGATTTVMQSLISGGAIVNVATASALGIVCTGGPGGCCDITLLINADFFPTDSTTTTVTISGSGLFTTVVPATRRRLGDGRVLEEELEADFETTIEIEGAAGDSGGMLVRLTNVAAVAGVAALLI